MVNALGGEEAFIHSQSIVMAVVLLEGSDGEGCFEWDVVKY